MNGKVRWTICVMAAAMFAGCESNKNKPTTMASSAAADHEPAVCKVDGEGNAVKATAAAPAAAPAKVAVFGGEQKLSDADAVPASMVLADPAAYANKVVRVTGKVSSVCEKKGCWLRVVPADKTASAADAGDIFIKFRDPPAGRLIPMDAVGHNVTVEGTLKQGMMSEAAARHFKEDAGASEEELKKIVGPQKQLVIAQPVVAIEGVEKPAD